MQLFLIFANINISIFYHHFWLVSPHIVQKLPGYIFAYLRIKYLGKNHSSVLSIVLILSEFQSSLDQIPVSTFSRVKLKVLWFKSLPYFLAILSQIIEGLTGTLWDIREYLLLPHKEPLPLHHQNLICCILDRMNAPHEKWKPRFLN